MPSQTIAPCRVFHAETGQLIAGAGTPLPGDIPAHLLRYEDPAYQPAPEPKPAPASDSDGREQPEEPQPKTVKRRGTRTRVRPPADNRAAPDSQDSGE